MLIEYLVSPNCLAWRPRSVTSMFYYCYHTVVPSSHGSCAARVLLVYFSCARLLVSSSARLHCRRHRRLHLRLHQGIPGGIAEFYGVLRRRQTLAL